jgi:hypothetical protein
MSTEKNLKSRVGGVEEVAKGGIEDRSVVVVVVVIAVLFLLSRSVVASPRGYHMPSAY